MQFLRNKFRQFARLAAHSQLLPILESGDDPLIGGQAVIEGVMMRAPHSYSIAVRRPDGVVVTDTQRISRPSEKYPIFKLPVFRGVATLGQAMSLGMKSLQFSAQHAAAEEDEAGETKPAELPKWMMALNIAFTIGFFIFMYKFVPLFLTTEMQSHQQYFGGAWLDTNIGFNLVDGIIRLAIFLSFLFLISRMKDIRRVFEYHGAEHKVVFNYESGKPVNVDEARGFVTFHPRCGTSFLMVVMVVSILVYAMLPFESFGMKMLSRVVLLPVIAGLSYEVIRFASRKQGTIFAAMVLPGLWLQRITTKEPADDQLEISILALDGAMRLEREQDGELVIA
jgi:uncharacterized protein YqhQ